MTPMQLRLVHIGAVSLYAFFLLGTLWIAQFAWVGMSGEPGNASVDLLGTILRKLQGSSLGAMGELISAIPAFSLALATTSDGALTKRGWHYLWLLAPTFVIAFIVSFFFDPSTVDLGEAGTPQIVATTAGRMSNFALTFMIGIFGLRKLMPASNAEKAK